MNASGKANTEQKLNKSAAILIFHAPNRSIARPPQIAASAIPIVLPALAIPAIEGELVNCKINIGMATAAIWFPNRDKDSATIKPMIGSDRILGFIVWCQLKFNVIQIRKNRVIPILKIVATQQILSFFLKYCRCVAMRFSIFFEDS